MKRTTYRHIACNYELMCRRVNHCLPILKRRKVQCMAFIITMKNKIDPVSWSRQVSRRNKEKKKENPTAQHNTTQSK